MSDKLPNFDELEELPEFGGLEEISADALPSAEGLVDPEEPEYSQGETALLHAVKGLTMGASGMIGGAAGAAGHLAGEIEQGKVPSLKELRDAYYEAKEWQKGREKESADEHPKTAFAADIAGSFAIPIPGAALAKAGKVGKAASSLLPSVKGAKKISDLSKQIKVAEKVGNIAKLNKLKQAKALATVGYAAKEGTKAGAIAGFTTGDSKLLEGDIGGTAAEIGIGSGVGAAGSLALVGAGKLFTMIPGVKHGIESLSQGLKGKSLDPDIAEAEALTRGKLFYRKINKMWKGLAKEQGNIEEIITRNGGIQTRDDLVKIRAEVLKQPMSTQQQDKVKSFFGLLEDTLEGSQALNKAKDKMAKKMAKAAAMESGEVAEDMALRKSKDASVKKQISSIVKGGDLPDEPPVSGIVEGADDISGAVTQYGDDVSISTFTKPKYGDIEEITDKATGKLVLMAKDQTGGSKPLIEVLDVPTKYDATQLSSSAANELKEKLHYYAKLAEMDPSVKKLAKQAAGMIKDKLEGKADDLSLPLKDVNRKLSNLIATKKRLKFEPFEFKEAKDKTVEDLAHFIAGVGSKKSQNTLNNVHKYIKEVDPKYADEFMAEVMEFRKRYELAKPDEISKGLLMRNLVGPLDQMLNRATNAVGRGIYGAKEGIKKSAKAIPGVAKVAERGLQIVEMPKNQLKNLAERVNSSENPNIKKFFGPLSSALDTDSEQRRNAILWGLSQQPAFRKIIEEFNED